MANYPTSLDSMTNPSSSTFTDDSGFELDVLIARLQDVAEALEAKVGVGASTPSSGTVLRGTGSGSSAYGQVATADIAPGASETLIAAVAGTGASGVLEISSIPNTYGALRIEVVGRSDVAGSGGASATLTFQTTPSAGLYNHVLLIATTTVSSSENIGATASIAVGAVPSAGSTADVYGSMTIWLPRYASGATFKPVQAVCNSPLTLAAGSYQLRVSVGTYENPAAIDRVRLTLGSGNWTTASRMALYGGPG